MQRRWLRLLLLLCVVVVVVVVVDLVPFGGACTMVVISVFGPSS